jgi:hypothetical protein
MITVEEIQEILSLYKKHGWNLRRVLLSDGLRVNINEHIQDLFGGAEIVSSPFLNALWFARASGKTGEAWELRHLSETPFALVQVFPGDMTEEAREEIRNEMQTRIVNQTSKPASRKPEN